MAKEYGLSQSAIRGISPESELAPEDLQNVGELVHKDNIKYIFFETLASPKLAEMLAKETGVKVAVLDQIEGLDDEGKKEELNYLEIQRENIENLKNALME